MKEKICPTSIGGQALIEGVLMRGPEKTSMAVRKPDGEIALKVEESKSLLNKHRLFKLPFIRGIVSLLDSLTMGMGAIDYSASFFEDEEIEEEDSFFDKQLNKLPEKVQGGLIFALALVLALGLFFFLPTIITNFFSKYIQSPIGLNLIEGGIRILIFFAYIVLVSQMDDMARIFKYHGAEHKSIYAYEKGRPLTVENVRQEPMLHPRCGTSFLFSVMLVSIIVLSFFGWQSTFQRFLTRIIALPIIVGISYEINRILGRTDNFLSRLMTYPGLAIQKFATVKEPDDSMIEVAILALEAVIPEDGTIAQW